jgi:excisionase family DNA binding protein
MKLRDGDLMTPSDAGKVLGVTRGMVLKLVLAGRVPSVRTVGGVRLLWARDVAALAKARAKVAARAMAVKAEVAAMKAAVGRATKTKGARGVSL